MWYEIDDEQDLDIAESLFLSGKERLHAISGRYGGYWRYPGLKDFCYLVNPFYPGKKLVEEMQASFLSLLTNYPSGMAGEQPGGGKILRAQKRTGLRGERGRRADPPSDGAGQGEGWA